MGTSTSTNFGVRTANQDRIVVDSSGRVRVGVSGTVPGAIWNGTVPEFQVDGVVSASAGFDCKDQGITCGGINPYNGHIGQGTNAANMLIRMQASPLKFLITYTGATPSGGVVPGAYDFISVVGGVVVSAS